jgi:titin
VSIVARVRGSLSSLRRRSARDRGATAVEYGILLAAFGTLAVGITAGLVTATSANYDASEEAIGAAPLVCPADQFFDASAGICVAQVTCTAGEWRNPDTNTCEEAVTCTTGFHADTTTNTCVADTRPTPPRTLTGTATSATAVTLAWSPPVDNGGSSLTYRVERSQNGSNGWVTLTTFANTTYNAAVPSGWTTAYFRVFAINATGTSDASNIATVPLTVSGAPTITGITASYVSSQHRLSVAFTPPAFTASITNYEYSTDNGTTWKARTDVTGTGSPILITQTSAAGTTPLAASTTYQIRIRGVKTGGLGVPSPMVVGRTFGVPGPPEILQVTAGNAQLSVDFCAPQFDGAVNQTVCTTPSSISTYQYSTDNGATWKNRSPNSTSSPLVITQTSAAGTAPLVNGTTYTVRIRAVNAIGAGTASGPVTGTPGAVPSAPVIGNPTASVVSGVTQISVPITTFSTGTPAVQTYQYSTDSGETWRTRSAGTTASPLVITTRSAGGALENATAYTIQVRGVNAIGNSAPSNSRTVTTPNGVPNAPTITDVTWNSPNASASFVAGSSGGSSITTYQYSTDNGATWKARPSGSTASPLTFTQISGAATNLVAGTTYQVRLRAVSGAGNGTPSAAFSFTPGAKPNAPTITSITGTNQQLSVAFTAGTAVTPATTTYEYSTDGGVTWRKRDAGTTASPIVITRSSGSYALLVNGTTYSVRIRAVNPVGRGAPSNAVTGTPVAPPGKPRNVSATLVASPAGITVSWQAPSYTGGGTIAGYRIQQSSDGGATWTTVGDQAGTSRTIPGASLAPSTTYVFRVAAYNTGGDFGAYSAPTSSVSTPGPPNTPNAPTAVVLTSTKQINVSWTAPSGPTPSGYEVEVSSDAGTTWSAPIASATTSLGLTTSNFPALAAGTSYVFRVSASSGWGAGTPSAASIAYLTPSAPAAPTGLTGVLGDEQVALSWNSSVGATSYSVQRAIASGGPWTTIASPAGTTATASGLTSGTDYYFQVAATNAWAIGDFSAVAGPFTPFTTPGAPATATLVRIGSSGSNAARISWTPPTSDGGSDITSYRVESVAFSGGGGGCGSSWSTAAPGATGIDKDARSIDVTYSGNRCFRVIAVNAAGPGTPRATTPTNLNP